MSKLRNAASYVWDFVVGDDWRLAVAVLLGLVAAWLVARHGAPAWWILPLVVMIALGTSLARVGRADTS